MDRRHFMKSAGDRALGFRALSQGTGLATHLTPNQLNLDKPTLSRIHEYKASIDKHLFDGLIPFWLSRAPDKEYGGFLTNFDEKGDPLHTPEKYVNTQCRLIWWFSTLHRRLPEIPGTADLARHGVDFLIQHFWDERFGGFFWKVKRDGSQLDNAKIVYGESFCIYALSEYYLATGDHRGLEYADRLFDLLQKYCADTRFGGYRENVNADWSPEASGFAGGDRKSLDTHMHLMEAFTTLYAGSGDTLHLRKLLEIVELIRTRMIDKESGCGLNQFDLGFNSIPAIAIKRTWNGERMGERPPNPVDTTSYGHNVELAFLMHLAMKTAHADESIHLPVYRRLFDHALAHGIDWQYGGIYRDGLRSTGEPIVLEKEFWQHSEALHGFLDGYELFGDPRYLDAFASVWTFVRDHMIVESVGEWRTLLDRTGKPIDANIGNPWKASYHSGRAMLESHEHLTRLAN